RRLHRRPGTPGRRLRRRRDRRLRLRPPDHGRRHSRRRGSGRPRPNGRPSPGRPPPIEATSPTRPPLADNSNKRSASDAGPLIADRCAHYDPLNDPLARPSPRRSLAQPRRCLITARSAKRTTAPGEARALRAPPFRPEAPALWAPSSARRLPSPPRDPLAHENFPTLRAKFVYRVIWDGSNGYRCPGRPPGVETAAEA